MRAPGCDGAPGTRERSAAACRGRRRLRDRPPPLLATEEQDLHGDAHEDARGDAERGTPQRPLQVRDGVTGRLLQEVDGDEVGGGADKSRGRRDENHGWHEQAERFGDPHVAQPLRQGSVDGEQHGGATGC